MTALLLALALSSLDGARVADEQAHDPPRPITLQNPPIPAAVQLEAPAAVPTGSWVLVDGSNSSSARPLVWIVKPMPPGGVLKLDSGDRKAVFLALKAPPAGVYAITAVAVGRDGSADPPAEADGVTVIVGDVVPAQPAAPTGQDRPADPSPVGRPRWAYLVDRGGFARAQQGLDGFWTPLFRDVYPRVAGPSASVPVGFSATPKGRDLFRRAQDAARALPDTVPSDRTPTLAIERDGAPSLKVTP